MTVDPNIEAGAAELRQAVAGRTWFHTIDLGNGVRTPGHKDTAAEWEHLHLPDLAGRSVLDVGAYDGFFSFEAERRGAARVVASDHWVWNWPGSDARGNFELAWRTLGSRVQTRDIPVEEISPDTLGATFDVVLFLGVLYHAPRPSGLPAACALGYNRHRRRGDRGGSARGTDPRGGLLRRRFAERRCQQPLRAQPAGRGGDAARCRILPNHRVPAVDRQQGVGHPEHRRAWFIAAASYPAAASPAQRPDGLSCPRLARSRIGADDGSEAGELLVRDPGRLHHRVPRVDILGRVFVPMTARNCSGERQVSRDLPEGHERDPNH